VLVQPSKASGRKSRLQSAAREGSVRGEPPEAGHSSAGIDASAACERSPGKGTGTRSRGARYSIRSYTTKANWDPALWDSLFSMPVKRPLFFGLLECFCRMSSNSGYGDSCGGAGPALAR